MKNLFFLSIIIGGLNIIFVSLQMKIKNNELTLLQHLAFNQTNQNGEIKKLLCKKWRLIQESTCDRCPTFFPKDTLLAIFYENYTCKGVIVTGTDTATKGKWHFDSNILKITYNGREGINSDISYVIQLLNDNVLVLVYQPYFGTSIREFKKH